MLRVLGPDGRLLTVFSARPGRRPPARLWRPLERIVAAGFAGRFVRTSEVPFHQCRVSQRRFPRFAPTAAVFLGRCCLEALTIERRRYRPGMTMRTGEYVRLLEHGEHPTACSPGAAERAGRRTPHASVGGRKPVP